MRMTHTGTYCQDIFFSAVRRDKLVLEYAVVQEYDVPVIQYFHMIRLDPETRKRIQGDVMMRDFLVAR